MTGYLLSVDDLIKKENDTMATLISMYEQNKCLWDMSDDHYRDRAMKEDAWDSLFEYYHTAVYNPDLKKMKTTFSNMRACWRREHKLVKASMRKGSGAVHQPKLWYYEHLSFLATGGVDRDEVDKNSVSSDSESTVPIASQRPRKATPSKPRLQSHAFFRPEVRQGRETNLFQTQNAVLEAARNRMSAPNAPVEQENKWVTQGKLWGLSISELEEEQRNIAVKLFSDVIYLAQLKMLNPGASVSAGVPQHSAYDPAEHSFSEPRSDPLTGDCFRPDSPNTSLSATSSHNTNGKPGPKRGITIDGKEYLIVMKRPSEPTVEPDGQ